MSHKISNLNVVLFLVNRTILHFLSNSLSVIQAEIETTKAYKNVEVYVDNEDVVYDYTNRLIQSQASQADKRTMVDFSDYANAFEVKIKIYIGFTEVS